MGVVSGRQSAGILLYRGTGRAVEVLLAHPGGPFWRHRDDGAWSLPKGEYDSGEEPLAAARREFEEELGLPVPAGEPVELGSVRQKGGKIVTAWAVEGDLDPRDIDPGVFEIEWPRGSGRVVAFPEVDRVAWFDLETARGKILAGQRPLLDRLAEATGPERTVSS